ncbi:hypothetical protein ZWY2020_054342 [Hordeum vulgare]|nr:hypothetical protein ZWY2020_054342 [Hordeum vulgare]
MPRRRSDYGMATATQQPRLQESGQLRHVHPPALGLHRQAHQPQAETRREGAGRNEYISSTAKGRRDGPMIGITHQQRQGAGKDLGGITEVGRDTGAGGWLCT